MKNSYRLAILLLALQVPALGDCVRIQSCLESTECRNTGPINGITLSPDYETRTTDISGQAILITRYKDTWKCEEDAVTVTSERSGDSKTFYRTVYNVPGIYEAETPDQAPIQPRQLALDLAGQDCARQSSVLLTTETHCQ